MSSQQTFIGILGNKPSTLSPGWQQLSPGAQSRQHSPRARAPEPPEHQHVPGDIVHYSLC